MTVQQAIESKLGAALEPVHLEVIDESGMHQVPPGSESHFRVRIISRIFEGQVLLRRHRMVHRVLELEIRDSVHALALETLTPAEWDARDRAGQHSPPCLGGE